MAFQIVIFTDQRSLWATIVATLSVDTLSYSHTELDLFETVELIYTINDVCMLHT